MAIFSSSVCRLFYPCCCPNVEAPTPEATELVEESAPPASGENELQGAASIPLQQPIPIRLSPDSGWAVSDQLKRDREGGSADRDANNYVSPGHV